MSDVWDGIFAGGHYWATKALFPLVPTIDSTRIQLDSFSILFEYHLMHIGSLQKCSEHPVTSFLPDTNGDVLR